MFDILSKRIIKFYQNEIVDENSFKATFKEVE